MLGGSKTGDPRIRRLLDQLELKYTVTDANDFKLIFGLGHERSQTVFVNSNTATYRNIEVREVWAPAYTCKGDFPADVALRMLKDTKDKKFGAWAVLGDGDPYYAIYVAQISADTDAATLHSAIKLVTESADEMEQALGTGDVF